jgi:peroxiredoxin
MQAALIAALVVSWVFVGILLFLLFLLIREQGELRLYHQELEERLEIAATHAGAEYAGRPQETPENSGLPVGADAPDFALRDLEGNVHRRQDYLGKPFVIAFFATHCGYCLEMSPRLGELEEQGYPLVLVTHGELEANKRLAAEHGWQCDALIEPEDAWDVMLAYQAMGTPSGYLVDEEGRIASPVALGGDAVLALRTATPAKASENGHGDPTGVRIGPSGALPAEDEAESEGAATATATAVKTRDVAESNIVRDGLKAGTTAPNFVLRDLDGKGHSLGDYRGKRVLLVFSDVNCAPCEQMAPNLVRLHEKRPKDLEIVMISRGAPEANKLKATALGYPFPVLLQKSWEVSKLYGMFATPIGYLIDEEGVITKDVAVGPEPILDLV